MPLAASLAIVIIIIVMIAAACSQHRIIAVIVIEDGHALCQAFVVLGSLDILSSLLDRQLAQTRSAAPDHRSPTICPLY